MRRASIERCSNETQIKIVLNLDGTGVREIETGIGMFDHLLDGMAKHGLIDLTVKCIGDLAVDGHHTVEDVGICIGKAIREALGDRNGIKRFASSTLPMDEALAMVSLDISGRPYLHYGLDLPAGTMAGKFEVQLAEEFFRALSVSAGITLHINLLHGKNPHHMLEAMFKAFGRALADAAVLDERIIGIPSTKGMLD